MRRRNLALIPLLRRLLGFTMLEIMIILIVVGVLASLSIPSLNGFLASAKVDRTVAELRVAMSQSQRAAIRGGNVCGTSVVVQTVETSEDFQSALGTSCNETPLPTLPEGISVKSNMVITPMVDVLTANRGWFALNGFLLADARHRSSPTERNVESPDENGSATASGDDTDTSGADGTSASDDGTPAVLPSIRSGQTNSLGLSTIEQVIQASHKTFNDVDCKKWNGCDASQRDKMGVVDLLFNRQGAIDYDIQTNGTPVNDSSGIIVATTSNNPRGKMKCIAISRRIGLTRIGYYKGGLTPNEITQDGQCTTLEWDKQ